MADVSQQLTMDELNNSVEFKALKRAIRNEFPYVKDLVVLDEDLNKYNIIFFYAVIDPFIMRNYTGFEFKPWVMGEIKSNQERRYPFLSGIYQVTYEDDKEIREVMEDIAREIHKSKIIPDHLKLPRDRQPLLSGFIIPSGVKIPDEYNIDELKLWDQLARIRTTN